MAESAMGIVMTAFIFLFIHIHSCIHENLYRLFPSNAFFLLGFLKFPCSWSHCPCNFTPLLHQCLCSLLQILPSFWSLSLSTPGYLGKCRVFPSRRFLVLLNQQNSNWVAKNRAGTLKFIAQKVCQAQHHLLLPPLRATTSQYQLSER